MTKRAKRATRKAAKAAANPKAPPKLHGVPHNPDVEVEPRKWTRKEAEAHVRSLGLRCKGPVIPARMEHWQGLMADGKIDDARLVVTRGIPNDAHPDGYVPCNQDIGDAVIALPFDGSEQERTCPRCGTMNGWRQPVFDGLDETKAAKK